MPAVVVDGQDAEATYSATAEAVARARAGEGPSLIEGMTLRIRGHYEGDRQQYRGEAEPDDELRARDPLVVLRQRLDDRVAEAIDEEERLRVAAAFERALTSPRPDAGIIFRDLWAE